MRRPTLRTAATARSTLSDVVGAAERGEDVRHHRLDADGHAIDARRGVRGDQFLGDVVRVALDRDLRAWHDRHAPDHRGQRIGGHE